MGLPGRLLASMQRAPGRPPAPKKYLLVNPHNINARLRDARVDTKMSQRKFAAKAGLNPSIVGRIETKKTSVPSLETIVSWLHACGAKLVIEVDE